MSESYLNGQTIELIAEDNPNRKRIFRINRVLGRRGANCVAYDAVDIENKLRAVVKECFPKDGCSRNEDGRSIRWEPKFEDQAKTRFRNAFEIQRKLYNDSDTTDACVSPIDNILKGGNTLYTASIISSGVEYTELRQESLEEIFETVLAVTKAVGDYHKHGVLHLDIKPSNILVQKNKHDNIWLIDYDSVLPIDAATDFGVPLSYTQEYAAPELLQGKRDKICKATDIYSIGALIFARILGHKPSGVDWRVTPTAIDRRDFSKWDFQKGLFGRLSNKTKRLTTELLRKSLSASIKSRYQNVSELIKMLEELIEECRLKKYLNSTCPPSSNLFVGRHKELKQIHDAFTAEKHAVFLCGMGGIGKTELALEYAARHKDYFDVIAFGRYKSELNKSKTCGEEKSTSGLEILFKSPDFISIENNSESELGIESVRGLVDERTLLIIDNFDVESDEKLGDVLSLECKLLFTSRESFEEPYGNEKEYVHLRINELTECKQIALFEQECGRNITKDEHPALQEILQNIEGYTLLIPLIAKAYKNGTLSLEEIGQRISVSGLKSMPSVNVRHHKDRPIKDSLYNIICEVLKLSLLTDDEKRVLCCISLYFMKMGKHENDIVRLQAEANGEPYDGKPSNSFLRNRLSEELASRNFSEIRVLNAINSLSDKNWLSISGVDNKAIVMLHAVIVELVRFEIELDYGMLSPRFLYFIEYGDINSYLRFPQYYRNIDWMQGGLEKYLSSSAADMDKLDYLHRFIRETLGFYRYEAHYDSWHNFDSLLEFAMNCVEDIRRKLEPTEMFCKEYYEQSFFVACRLNHQNGECKEYLLNRYCDYLVSTESLTSFDCWKMIDALGSEDCEIVERFVRLYIGLLETNHESIMTGCPTFYNQYGDKMENGPFKATEKSEYFLFDEIMRLAKRIKDNSLFEKYSKRKQEIIQQKESSS